MGGLSTKFNPLRRSFYALEDIDAGDIVYAQPRYLIDDFQDYADGTFADDVWVPNDAVNLTFDMVNELYSTSLATGMILAGTAGQATGDYADKTISSTDYTGFTVNIIARASAASGDWEFLMASGANAATNNEKKALVFSGANAITHIQFAVADMSADNGSYNSAATLHFGLRCADDTGTPSITVYMIYLTKTGEPTGAIRSVDAGFRGDSVITTHLPIGVAEAAITSGNRGMVTMFGPTVQDNFTYPINNELVPGWSYGATNASPGAVSPYYIDSGGLNDVTGNTIYSEIGIAISTTEMMLRSVPVIIAA